MQRPSVFPRAFVCHKKGVKMSEKLNVLILAAGLGTRLRPLTNDIPKPLVQIVDASILEIQTNRAKQLGDIRLHANAHYLANQIIAEGKRLGFEKIWEESELLGTAGPLKRIYNEGFRGGLLIMNGDAYCQFDFNKFIENAKQSKSDVALLAVDFPAVNTLCVNAKNQLNGIAGRFGLEDGMPATFSGFSWYSDSALARIKDNEFDIREFWKQEIESGNPPFVDLSQKNALWIDMGSPEGLKAASDARLKELGLSSWGKNAGLNSVVCNNASVPASAIVKNSIIFADAEIAPNEVVENEIRGRNFSWKV